MEVTAPAAPQAPTPEASTEPTAPAPQPVSPQFQALAKKEAAIVKRQQELKRLEEELKGKQQQYSSWEEKKSKAKTNPLEALQELGLSYEQITQYILNDKKATPDMEVASVKDEIAKIREEFERKQKEEREQIEQHTKAQQEQQIAQFKADLGDYIAENSEKYECLAMEGDDAVELIYDTIRTDWQTKLEKYEEGGRIGRPPKVMSTEEASELVEKFYEEKADKFFSLKKFSSKYQKAESAEPQPGQAPQPQMPKTLNNGLVQPSSPTTLPPKNEQERIARALAKLG